MHPVLRGECLILWAPALLTNTQGLPLKAFLICVFWGGIRFDLSRSLSISMHTLVKSHRLSLLTAVPGVLIQYHRFMSCAVARSTKTQWSGFQKDKLHRSIHDLKQSL